MAKPNNSFKCLQHVAIKVSNIDESLEFYTNVLGFTLSERHGPGEHPLFKTAGMCFLRCTALHHDINLLYHAEKESAELRKMPKPDQGASLDLGYHHIAFQVENLRDFREWENWLQENNIEIVRGPLVHSPTHPEGDGTWGENRAMYFCDPDGHRIEIFCDMAELSPETNEMVPGWLENRLEKERLEV